MTSRSRTVARWLLAALALLVLCASPSRAEEVAGTTQANFAVSPDGNATYSVPLMIPPGTAGIEPSLALVYSSQGGPSPYGFGWSLSGLSQIQRGPKNLSDDGIVEGVELRAADSFFLDGEKLVEIDSELEGVREFRTRIESYSRVRAFDWSDYGPAYFVVETRAGLTMTYGRDVRARVGNSQNGRILTWLLEKVEDRSGNYMVFSYESVATSGPQSLDYVIDRVRYTGNDAQGLRPYAEIRFAFRTLPDAEVYGQRYVMGEPVAMRRQLEFIESHYRGEVLRRYTPSFSATSKSDRFFTIASLREEAGGLSYQPLQFSYPGSDPSWIESALMEGITDLPNLGDVVGNVPEAYRYANLPKGTGTVPSVLVAANAGGKSISEAFLYDSAQGTWKKDAKFKPSVELALSDGVNRTVLVTDIDGDGDDDLLVGEGAGSGPARTYLAGPGGWTEVDAFPVDIRSPTPDGNGLLFVDIIDRNGAHQSAVAWDHIDPITGNRKRDVRRWDGRRWANVAGYSPPISFALGSLRQLTGVRSIDVDCDGTRELVYFRVAGKAGGHAVYRATDRGWQLETDLAFQFALPEMPADAALKLADLDGDGCDDIAYSFDAGEGLVSGVRLARATGWIEAVRDFNDVAFWRAGVGDAEQLAGDLIDIDGDARPDLIEGEPGKYRTYRAAGSSWIADTKLNIDAPLGQTRDDRALSSARTRLGGQGGWVWIDLRPRGGALAPNVLRYDPALGWAAQSELEPPVDIAKFDKVDLGIRFLDLNNDGLPDIAWSIRKKKDDSLDSGVYLFTPGTAKPWRKDPRFALPVELSREDFRASGTMLADINGDGVADILHARGSTGRGQSVEVREAYINCSTMARCADAPADRVSGFWLKASETAGLQELVPPTLFATQGTGDLGVQVLDINGDGLSDIVAARDVEVWRDEDGNEVPADTRDAAVVYELRARTWLNSGGTRWSESEAHRLPVALVRPVIRSLNGFGVGDEEQIPGLETISTGVQLLDLNGDRLPDVIYRFEAFQKSVSTTGQTSLRAVPFSGAVMGSAQGWVTQNSAYIPPQRLDDDPAAPERRFLIEDLNNDGNPDLFYTERGKARTLLNTGLGWSAPSAAYAIPDRAIRDGKGDQGFRLLDLNADMLPDIVYHWTTKDDGAERGVYFNTGTGWIAGDQNDAPSIPFARYKLGDTGVRPLDVDGDGLLDIVESFRRSENDLDRRVQINTSPRPYLLTQVENGLGSTMTIQYQSFLADEAEAAPGGTVKTKGTSARLARTADTQWSYPMVNSPLPGFLVQSVSSQGPGVAPRTTMYAYGGNRTDIRSGRSLGFERTETLDKERCRLTRTTFSQEDGLLGSPLKSETVQFVDARPTCDTTGNGVVIATSRSTWSADTNAGKEGASGVADFTPRMIVRHLDQSESMAFDLTSTMLEGQTSTFTYDPLGNARTVETVFADGSGTRTINEYDDDEGRWLLARLKSATVTHFAPGQPDDVRRATFTYDQYTGLIESETAFAGTDKALVTTYARDRFGNKSGSTSARPDGSMARSQSVEFDSEGRFVESIVNALGHRARTIYDPKSGAVLRQIDPNGVAESYTYDALQRLKTRNSPTGVVSQVTVERVRDQSQFALLTRAQTQGYPETRTYADAAGRTVRVESKGWGGRTIIATSRFDDLGRATSSTLPYFQGDAVYSSSRTYDLLDRVIESTRPDNAKSTTRYDGLTTISTGPTGQTSITMTDLRGRVWKTIDNLGGETLFAFDTSGRIVSTTNVSGQAIIQRYDAAGNRISLSDPTTGEWAYEYDVYGNLVLQIDPRGARSVLEHDALNRLRVSTASQPHSEQAPTAAPDVAKWDYDAAENAIGKLVRSEWAGGDHRSYTYDRFGRPIGQYERIGRDSLTIADTLDAYGRLTSRSYNTGVRLDNRYDSYGNLIEATLRDGGLRRSVYELLALDALGRVTRERMGSGIVTVNDYDQARGFLTKSKTIAANDVAIQDLSLRYDLVGNLIEMSDRVIQEFNTYGFDELNRLDRATLSGREEVRVTYDPMGNITSKSDVGTYAYCDVGSLKLLLCETSGADGSMRFNYDAAGNTTVSGDRGIAFDARGKVLSITGLRETPLEGTRSKFRYDADGGLVTQSSVYGPKAHTYSSAFFSGVQIVRENYAPPDKKLPAERTILRHTLSSGSGVIGYYDKVYRHFPLRSAAPTYGQIMVPKPEKVTDFRFGFSFMVKDHLGSIRAMVSETGIVLDRFRYDPWGKRIESDGYRYRKVKEGFTGHLMLDNLGLIHMGGRVYDPHLGRFLSPDPFIQAPFYSQSYNRYSYVLNNPLRFTDPSGYWSLGRALGRAFGGLVGGTLGAFARAVDAVVGKPIAWLGEQLAKGGRWLRENWRTVAIIAIAVALPATGALWGSVILQGAAVGGLSAALYGGGPDEILKGAIIGGITGAAFGAVGDAKIANRFVAAGAHGAVGGVSSVMNGGSFESGFLSGGLTKFTGGYIPENAGPGFQIASAAIVGGVASEIGGGSFENGAITGAFSRLFNDCAHETNCGFGAKEPELGNLGFRVYLTEGDPLLDIEMHGSADLRYKLSENISMSLSNQDSYTFGQRFELGVGWSAYASYSTSGTGGFGVAYKIGPLVSAQAGVTYGQRGGGVSVGASAGRIQFRGSVSAPSVRSSQPNVSPWTRVKGHIEYCIRTPGCLR